MIYWKQVNVFGLPTIGELVFIYFDGEIWEAALKRLDYETLVWERVVCYTIEQDGRHPVTIYTPLEAVHDWSEMNMPLTFTRKPTTLQS